MDGQHDVTNQPRDDHGRWTSGGSFADGSTSAAMGGGVGDALAGLPIAVHDRLDAMVSSFGRQFLSNIAGALPKGKRMGRVCWLTRSIRSRSMAKAGSDARTRR